MPIAAVPSSRLVQVLRTYCYGLTRAGLHDLRRALAEGRYRWLMAELTAAIEAQSFAPDVWADIIGPVLRRAERPSQTVLLHQLRIWKTVYPRATPPVPSAGPRD